MCKPNVEETEKMSPKSAIRRRRGKRDKTPVENVPVVTSAPAKTKRKSRALQKHGADKPSGGIEALLPSFIGLAVLGFGLMAKMGFRGRASVAGIDLGTTNSVICVQAPAKGIGEIQCIPDDTNGSPIIPSVVSFLEPSEIPVGPSSKVPSLLKPHPTAVVVGQTAKRRIDSHPHHTLYHAKRVLGRSSDDEAVAELRGEVEFTVQDNDNGEGVLFQVPDTPHPIPPSQVGSYVVSHLMKITEKFLGHENVKSAVICVPAKFNQLQRMATHEAFQRAGVKVARVVEEPTAAALAYGLHKKQGVDYILVYDFGGGTLDVSLLYVTNDFVDVMGSDGDDRLGGADFDAAVANFLLTHGGQGVVDRVSRVLERLAQKLEPGRDLDDALASACPTLEKTPLCTSSSFHTIGEELKITLSAYPDGEATANSTCMGLSGDVIDQIQSLTELCAALTTKELSINSDQYTSSVQSLYDRAVTPVTRLLADLDLTPGDIDEVVMVGGSTRMPHIRKLVQRALPTAKLNTHIDPDITVAYGAASVID